MVFYPTYLKKYAEGKFEHSRNFASFKSVGIPSNPEKIGLEPWLDIENSAIWRAHKKIETQKNLPDSIVRSGKGGVILEETTKQLVEVTLPPDYLGGKQLRMGDFVFHYFAYY